MTYANTAYESLKASQGSEIGVSNWIQIDQKMIDVFAAVTLDDQFIHTDPVRAKTETPFGGTIAHGFLILSLASRFAFDCFTDHPGQVMGMNYGFDKVRFLAPVACGSRVRGRFVASDVARKSDTQILQTSSLFVEIENAEKPALVADWLTMTFFKS
ncbi:MaoC family dehydratase [Lentibacter sp.]|uniref:MaoC family dehydratase n=1 Tax=Lentibacter sp. TaxID=2024994 RepID=UPI003F6D82A1